MAQLVDAVDLDSIFFLRYISSNLILGTIKNYATVV